MLPAQRSVRTVLACAVSAVVLTGCAAPRLRADASPSRRTTLAGTPTKTVPAASAAAPSLTPAAARVPRPAHIVVVMEENHSYADIIGSSKAPYLNSLARAGALFTNSYAITHPSEPNYLALFSGSTHGLAADSCPHTYGSTNLGHQLRAARLSFAGYSESLPTTGYTGCTSGLYARKHVPWTDFSDLPRSVNKPFTAFPKAYGSLPGLSFVVPNLDRDMHNGTIGQADSWLRQHLAGYATWARTHNSLLVVTWDEDDHSAGNHIPTIIVGAHVRRAHYGEHLTHYRLLRTLEALTGLPGIGHAAGLTPVSDIWSG